MCTKTVEGTQPHLTMSSNVKVVIRIRPNKSGDGENCIEKLGDDEVQLIARTNESLRYKDLLPGVMRGENATIFCYGITGSGKTHTMQGTGDDPGVTPKSVHYIFQLIEAQEELRGNYAVRLSYFEVYNDKIFDLLTASSNSPQGLPLREDTNKEIIVQNLEEKPFSTMDEFVKLYNEGLKNRKTGSNGINLGSSRSHAVLRIRIHYRDAQRCFQSKLNLIDLAGSEDNRRTNNTGSRMTESSAINTSLFVLAQVVEGLRKGSARIPYRDSTLTRLLQDSLGGTARTLMIANVAPGKNHVLNTMRTLEFASSSRQIVNNVVVNEVEFQPPNVRLARGYGAGNGSNAKQSQTNLQSSLNLNLGGKGIPDDLYDEIMNAVVTRLEMNLNLRQHEMKNTTEEGADSSCRQAFFKIELLRRLLQDTNDTLGTAIPEDLSPRSRMREAKAEILKGKELKELDSTKSLEHYRRAYDLYPTPKLKGKIESIEKKLDEEDSFEDASEFVLNSTKFKHYDDVVRTPFRAHTINNNNNNNNNSHAIQQQSLVASSNPKEVAFFSPETTTTCSRNSGDETKEEEGTDTESCSESEENDNASEESESEELNSESEEESNDDDFSDFSDDSDYEDSGKKSKKASAKAKEKEREGEKRVSRSSLGKKRDNASAIVESSKSSSSTAKNPMPTPPPTATTSQSGSASTSQGKPHEERRGHAPHVPNGNLKSNSSSSTTATSAKPAPKPSTVNGNNSRTSISAHSTATAKQSPPPTSDAKVALKSTNPSNSTSNLNNQTKPATQDTNRSKAMQMINSTNKSTLSTRGEANNNGSVNKQQPKSTLSSVSSSQFGAQKGFKNIMVPRSLQQPQHTTSTTTTTTQSSQQQQQRTNDSQSISRPHGSQLVSRLSDQRDKKLGQPPTQKPSTLAKPQLAGQQQQSHDRQSAGTTQPFEATVQSHAPTQPILTEKENIQPNENAVVEKKKPKVKTIKRGDQLKVEEVFSKIENVDKYKLYSELLEKVNKADEKTLTKLKGIGEKKAQKIISYREKSGDFASITDLMLVDGFGEAFVSNLLLKNIESSALTAPVAITPPSTTTTGLEPSMSATTEIDAS